MKDNKIIFEAPFLPDAKLNGILKQTDGMEYTFDRFKVHLKSMAQGEMKAVLNNNKRAWEK